MEGCVFDGHLKGTLEHAPKWVLRVDTAAPRGSRPPLPATETSLSRRSMRLAPKHHLAAPSWALPLLRVIQTAPVRFYLTTRVYWHLSSSSFQSREAVWQTRGTYISVALHPAADVGDFSSSVTLWHVLLHSALMTVTSLYFEQGAESRSKNLHCVQALLSRIRLQHLQTHSHFRYTYVSVFLKKWGVNWARTCACVFTYGSLG